MNNHMIMPIINFVCYRLIRTIPALSTELDPAELLLSTEVCLSAGSFLLGWNWLAAVLFLATLRTCGGLFRPSSRLPLGVGWGSLCSLAGALRTFNLRFKSVRLTDDCSVNKRKSNQNVFICVLH